MTEGRLVYLASPIDYADRDPAREKQRERLVHDLNSLGISVFDPAAAYFCHPAPVPAEQIAAINRGALSRSGGLVVLWAGWEPTLGVGMEIQSATGLGLPVAVVSSRAGRSAALGGLVDGLRVFPLSVEGVSRAARWLADHAHSGTTDSVRPVRFLLDGNSSTLPTRTHGTDVGFDLHVSEDTRVGPHSFADVPTGIRAEFPEGVWGRITGRSSTIRRRGLLVSEGILDEGYRGELFSAVWNLEDQPKTVAAGERIAQLILHENVTARFYPSVAAEVADSERGTAGFGSSGA